MEQQLTLIHRAYTQPIDPTTQVDRMPGTDAPCTCWHTGIRQSLAPTCKWPFCSPPEKDEQ